MRTSKEADAHLCFHFGSLGYPCFGDRDYAWLAKNRNGSTVASVPLAPNNSTSSPAEMTNHGKDKEGYWNCFHQLIQHEDAWNILHGMFPNHDIEFLYDQSSGYTMKVRGALSTDSMNKGWGGQQQHMNDLLLTEEIINTFGPHNHPQKLAVGDVQVMQFGTGPDAVGPFYLSHEEIEQQCHPHGEIIKKPKNCDDLKADLKRVGIGFKNSKKKVRLVELAQAAHIPLEKEVYEKQGWEGAPKGGLQLTAESGFIDPNEPLSKYAMEPKKEWLDDYGNIKDEFKKYYLHPLLDQRMDFKNAKTELEDLAELLTQTGGGMKCTVFFTPKCYCEIAGLGIEYSWGLKKSTTTKKLVSNGRRMTFLDASKKPKAKS